MHSTTSNHSYFKAFVKSNPQAKKVLFYFTSYAFPWWVYAIPIARFRKKGYEVVVYKFPDEIIENDDPNILPTTVKQVMDDVSARRKEYETRGIEVFHGIGNSLGSYMLLNYARRYPLPAIVLNGGGSVADIIFHHTDGSWKRTADAYSQKGYDLQKLRELWFEFDSPTLARDIKAKKILLTWSLKDGTIPGPSSQAFVNPLEASGSQIFYKADSLPHVFSVLRHAYRVKSLNKFLNTP